MPFVFTVLTLGESTLSCEIEKSWRLGVRSFATNRLHASVEGMTALAMGACSGSGVGPGPADSAAVTLLWNTPGVPVTGPPGDDANSVYAMDINGHLLKFSKSSGAKPPSQLASRRAHAIVPKWFYSASNSFASRSRARCSPTSLPMVLAT